MIDVVHFFYQNTKKGGVDTFLINLINNWPQNKTIFKIYVNKTHPGIINLKKKLKKKHHIIKYDFLLSQDLDNNNSLIFKSLLLKKIVRLYLLAKTLFFKNDFIEKMISSINKNSIFFIINGGYQGGEGCIKANLTWTRHNPSKKCFHVFHNNASKDKNFVHFIENYLRNKIDLILNNSKTQFITVSKSCANSMKNRKNMKSKKIKIIYNGVEKTNSYGKLKLNLRKKFNLNKNSKIILMLSVLESRKGFNFILKVCQYIFKLNNNIFLFIFGYGSAEEKNKVKNLINLYDLKGKVFLQDFSSQTNELYKQSNVTVIPSQFNESFGYTSIESFLYKTPVVSTNIGGLKEIINHNNNGYIINKKNYKKFGYYILKSINNKKNIKLLNNAYKDAKKKYNSLKMSREYKDFVSK